MSTTAILASGGAVTAALMSIPFVVAAGASPINRARDARRHAAETLHADSRTVGLVGQIRAGAEHARLADPDPGKLAAAAYVVAIDLADWIEHQGHPEDLPFMRRVLDELRPILDAEHVFVLPVTTMPPIQAAVALQLLLHHLRETCEGPRRARVSIAAGNAAEAIRALPDGCAVDFNPLGEFDTPWHRRAQAEWVKEAQLAGMGGWERALRV